MEKIIAKKLSSSGFCWTLPKASRNGCMDLFYEEIKSPEKDKKYLILFSFRPHATLSLIIIFKWKIIIQISIPF